VEILGKSGGDPLYNWNYLKNDHPNVKLVKGDIRSFEEVKAASKDVDAIVHAAAQVAVTTSLRSIEDFELGTQRLIIAKA